MTDPVPALLREIIQGLAIQQDALGVIDARLVVIETELTRERGPSETADVLRTLVTAVMAVGEQVTDLADAVRDTMLESEEGAESAPT